MADSISLKKLVTRLLLVVVAMFVFGLPWCRSTT